MTVGTACATSPSPPPQRPDIVPTGDTAPGPAVRMLRLTPGITVYDFRQSSDIRTNESSDTTHTAITTEAVISVAVTHLSDSTGDITISVDSVRITASGSAPARSQGQQSIPVSLGTVLRGSLGPQRGNLEAILPDSLCAYGQLVSTAREIILLPLPYEVSLTRDESWSDSPRFFTCRAGATIETRATREIRYSQDQPMELVLQTVAVVEGGGIMRTDSVTIRGRTTGSGRAFFQGENRLPMMIESESEGTLAVQLGDSTTVFHQRSTQEWHRRLPD